MPIKMVDAIAGSGKTMAIIKLAVQTARTQRRPVSISLPTIEVIKEKYADTKLEAGDDVVVLRVDSETAEAADVTVAVQLEQMLNDIRSDSATVLFTTHRSFLDCPNWLGRQHWKFYIDELFDVVETVSVKAPRSYSMLTAHLTLTSPDDAFSEVRAKRGSQSSLKLMRDGSDAAESILADVIKYLDHPERWTVYVNTKQYAAVTSGAGYSASADERDMAKQLTFWAIARPWFEKEGLDVTMASACFTDRLLYKLWSKQGISFEVDSDVTAQLQQTAHDGHHLKMVCMNIEHWSTWAKNGGVPFGAKATAETPQETFERLIAEEFGNDPFIFNANTTWTRRGLFPNGHQIKLVVHGKNEYSQYANVAFTASTLPTPDKADFLKSLGLEYGNLRLEYYHTHVYQTVFRSALRIAGNSQQVTAIIPCRGACAYLASKAPSATVVVREVLGPKKPRGRPSKGLTPEQMRKADTLRVWLLRNPGKTADDYKPRKR